MTYRDLQRAADCLGDVERALYAIRESLPGRDSPTVESGRPERQAKPRTLRHPELPRCKGNDKPCSAPVNAPYGLCVQHFLGLFGHTFGGNYTFEHQRGNYHCRKVRRYVALRFSGPHG